MSPSVNWPDENKEKPVKLQVHSHLWAGMTARMLRSLSQWVCTHPNSISHLHQLHPANWVQRSWGRRRSLHKRVAEALLRLGMKEQEESQGQDWRSKSTLPQPKKVAAANKPQQDLTKFRKRTTRLWRKTSQQSPVPISHSTGREILIPPSKCMKPVTNQMQLMLQVQGRLNTN